MSRYVIIAILLSILMACALKRKSAQTIFQSENRKTHTVVAVNKQEIKSESRLFVDSIKNKIALKIYPKEIFYLNEQGFMGSADSVIWMGEMDAVKRKQHWQNQMQKVKIEKKKSESYATKQKDSQRFSQTINPYFWWIITGSLFVAFLLWHLLKNYPH